MKNSLLITLIVFALVAKPSCSDAADVGIYFDTSAMTNCLPEVSTYPHSTTAYIIVTGAVEKGDIGGWQLSIDWDNILFVTPGPINGQTINLGTFPEFIVGIADPLPASSIVVLAELNIFAMGPGGVTIKGLRDGLLPSILFEGVPGEEALGYAYGDSTSFSANIGLANCPEKPVQEQLETTELIGSGAETYYSVMPDPNGGRNSSAAKSYSIYDGGASADTGFRGTVIAFSKECVEFSEPVPGMGPGGVGMMHVLVQVDSLFWGAAQGQVDVYIMGYDVPGCLFYSQDWGFPEIDEYYVGASCFVAARDQGEVYIITRENFEFLPGSKSASEGIDQLFGAYTDEEQIRDADLVVDARVEETEHLRVSYKITRTIKGDPPQELWLPRRRNDGSWVGHPGRGVLVRLYLLQSAEGWEPLHGRFSIQKRSRR